MKYSLPQIYWSFKNEFKENNFWDCSKRIYFNLDSFEFRLSKGSTYLFNF